MKKAAKNQGSISSNLPNFVKPKFVRVIPEASSELPVLSKALLWL
jgi:hypothetical protein